MSMKTNYDLFHKQIKLQKRIINESNYVYRDIVRITNECLGKNKNKKVLDYGCGAGTLSFYISNKGFSVVGVDISKNAIEMCKQNAAQFNLKNISFINSGKIPRKIKGLKFDLIICSEVIEHVDADIKLIRGLASLLKNNGSIIITTPSINAPLYKMGLLNEFDKRVGHLRRYSEKELLRRIKLSGLRVVNLYKREGILRNSLFNINGLGWIIKFIRGPMVDIVSLLDMFTVSLFGESDLQVVARKS